MAWVTAERVLGVDAGKSGWIGIALTGGTTTAYTATHIDQVVSAVRADGPIHVVAIDMPIGLPDAGPRRADQLARVAVGPQWRSVFMTPVRAATLQANQAIVFAHSPKLEVRSRISRLRECAGTSLELQAPGQGGQCGAYDRIAGCPG